MANTFTKAEKVAATALAILRREIVLPALVTSYTEANFRGAKNDFLTIPIRAIATANRRKLRETDPNLRKLKTNDLTESSIGIQLTDVIESGVAITDEQATLDIVSFGEQVLQPQLVSVAEDAEAYIHEAIQDAPYDADHVIAWDTGSTSKGAYNWAVDARKVLNKSNVPPAGRVLLVGPGAEAEILNDKKLEPGNPEGFGDSALRDANIGRLAGFTVITSNLLADDEAYAFHRTAYAFGNVAPVVPQGATSGARRATNGFAVRWLMDYDADQSTDRSVVTLYAGSASVNDARTAAVPAYYKNSTVDPDSSGGDDPWAAMKCNVRAVKLVLS